MTDIDQAAKAMRDEEMLQEIEDFIEGRSPARGTMVVDTATTMSGWQLLPGCGSLSRAAGRDRSIASSLRIIVSIFWVGRKKRTRIDVQ
jgi:hypothetical protein